MIVSVAQTRPEFGRIEANLSRALELCGTSGADLIVLPELFASGYLFADRAELKSLAQPVDGSIVTGLCALSASRNCAIVAGFAEEAKDRIYNSLALVAEGRLVTVYRKMHLFADETQIFDRAEANLQVAQAAGANIGLMICFDWVFPEVARCLSLQGAQILCHPSNLVLPFCQKAMVTRSIENGVFTLLANRVGRETGAGRDLTFTGGSEIVSPKGEVLAQAGLTEEELLSTEINPAEADNKWITARNHLFNDRRPEDYSAITKGRNDS